MTLGPRRLFKSFDTLSPSDFLKGDFLVGLAFGAGGVWLAISSPATISRVLSLSVGLLGAIIGAVIAGAAILGAFLDQSFLRKLRRIESEPLRYFVPFLFTAFVGTVAALLALILASLPDSVPTWLYATTAGLTGLATGWSIASLVFAIDALVGFLQLRDAAVDVKENPPSEGAIKEIRPNSG